MHPACHRHSDPPSVHPVNFVRPMAGSHHHWNAVSTHNQRLPCDLFHRHSCSSHSHSDRQHIPRSLRIRNIVIPRTTCTVRAHCLQRQAYHPVFHPVQECFPPADHRRPRDGTALPIQLMLGCLLHLDQEASGSQYSEALQTSVRQVAGSGSGADHASRLLLDYQPNHHHWRCSPRHPSPRSRADHRFVQQSASVPD